MALRLGSQLAHILVFFIISAIFFAAFNAVICCRYSAVKQNLLLNAQKNK